MVNPQRVMDMSHLMPHPEPDISQVIFSYKEAHKQYVCLYDILGPIETPISEAYQYVVQECPELARFKLYQDCTDFMLKELRYATGNRLKALVVWMTMHEDFWDRLGKSGTCAEYVVTWRIIWSQGLRYKLVERFEETKPWRRSQGKKEKLKSPVLPSIASKNFAAFH